MSRRKVRVRGMSAVDRLLWYEKHHGWKEKVNIPCETEITEEEISITSPKTGKTLTIRWVRAGDLKKDMYKRLKDALDGKEIYNGTIKYSYYELRDFDKIADGYTKGSCGYCGKPVWKRSWCEPSGCPHCNRSFVE